MRTFQVHITITTNRGKVYTSVSEQAKERYLPSHIGVIVRNLSNDAQADGSQVYRVEVFAEANLS